MPKANSTPVIDETTGLPQLPDDHVWRVGDSELAIVRKSPVGEWSEWSDSAYTGYGFTFMDVERETRQVERSTVHRKGFWVFKKSVTETESVKQQRSRTSAYSSVVISRKYGEYAVRNVGRFDTRMTYGGYYGGYRTERIPVYEERVELIKADPITSTNLQERALALFDEWQTRGEYPPKNAAVSS